METRPPPFILLSHSSLSYTTSLTIGFRTQVGKSSKVSHPKLPETSKRRERNKEFYQRPKGTTTNDTTLGLCLNSLFGWFFVLFFFIIICIFLLIEFFQSYVCSSVLGIVKPMYHQTVPHHHLVGMKTLHAYFYLFINKH